MIYDIAINVAPALQIPGLNTLDHNLRVIENKKVNAIQG